MVSRWRKLAGMPAVLPLALLILAACQTPIGARDDYGAIFVAERWSARNLPGFTAERERLTPRAIDRGDHWVVVYDPPPGQATAVPRFIIAKPAGRLIRVEYGG